MKKTSALQVYCDDSGEWRWRLRAANGRSVADGAEGYQTRRGCVRAVDALYRILFSSRLVVLAD